uniref:Myelin protein zero n=1 Tax=Scophthalmus maximus TaxID=52904 RepID=A0A8D3BPJ7_SCOMX
MLTFLALASVLLLGIVPEQSQAIVIYTGWERHALLGSDIRLSCSFFSWRWTSEDVTFSWTYRPDGSRDSISVITHTHTHTHTHTLLRGCITTGILTSCRQSVKENMSPCPGRQIDVMSQSRNL